MRLLHDPLKISARFDDPNLVSRAGLVPVMSLAERAGLFALAREQVSIGGPCGANAGLKIGCLVAGMAAGADSIDDLDVLRHGAMPAVFDGVRRRPRWDRSCARSPGAACCSSATSAGCCWRSWPAGRTCCPGAGTLAFVDVDS